MLRYEESLMEQELKVGIFNPRQVNASLGALSRTLADLLLIIDFGFIMQDIVVGEACANLRHQLDISYPVNNGIIQNWDDMCHVWDHAFFSELKVKIVALCLEIINT